MFDFLKKKITNFIDNITGKEEKSEEKLEGVKPVKKEETKTPEKIEKALEPELPKQEKPPKVQENAREIEKQQDKENPAVRENIKIQAKKVEIKEERREKPKKIEKKATRVDSPRVIEKEVRKIEVVQKKPTEAVDTKPKIELVVPKAEEIDKPQKKPEKMEVVKKEEIKITEPAKPKTIEKKEDGSETQKQEKERIKLSPLGVLKGFITREVEITEGEVKTLLDDLELELLEADVEISVAEKIIEDIRSKLVGSKIKKDELHKFVGQQIRETLITLMQSKKIDIVELSETKKPLKIMFIGINGAGKTTTMAKVAKLLLNNNKTVVFAAADTFRAAAIEQLGMHAEKLGVYMIKREYGSDPTSVAYDALNYEAKKMNRVIEPHLKIYVGESTAGNAIIEQISTFNKEIGVDGVILTKLDCDPKGGVVISINKATGIPIIYIGIGQRYEDLEQFDAEKITERIVG
ncbi:signal recognition particle receptor subunit alpha [Candidatus Micrarchaeota archaeon]|nr:signal recognition particle receptor subunit alpha [Candidatus Micrarchaeota archaeon]